MVISMDLDIIKDPCYLKDPIYGFGKNYRKLENVIREDPSLELFFI